MKHLFMIFVAVMLSVNMASAQKQTPIKPAGSYKQDGITFVSPNQSGWTLLKSEKLETLFERRDKDTMSNASIKIIKTDTFATDKDRLNSFEAMKKEELSRLNRDSIHFTYIRFKGSMCMEYDGIFKLEGAPAPKLEDFHIKGYLCPHPTIKDSAIQLEFSNYSNARDFSEDFISLSDQFFEKAAFSKTR